MKIPKSNHTMKLFFIIGTVLVAIIFSGMKSSAQDETPKSYLLRWRAEAGAKYAYLLSTSGLHGERIAMRSEKYEVNVTGVSDGTISFDAKGETVPDNARLGYRFQRSYFPDFPFTVSELGVTEAAPGQPFPVFVNVPIFPEQEVKIGDKWSGGPEIVLNDPNVGGIPFDYESTLSSVADFRGEDCAVIETDYTVNIPDETYSYVPFLGLVEGDKPEDVGEGAPIGGVVDGSPAVEAGIEPGDFIIEAEGQRIRGWAGLKEILPLLVPGKPVELVVKRGEEKKKVELNPGGVPIANITATGKLHSVCFFSIVRGIPLKVDLSSEELVFILTDSEGNAEDRPADIHYVYEYQYGGK
ncbi:MAG: PDZ domain-containing protein [bacterium]